MRTILITAGLLLLMHFSIRAIALPFGEDSTQGKKEQAAHWRLTGRTHGKGIFMFGGRVGSENPTFDVNFTYERKNWGMMFFKGQDFYDHTTFYNFALVAVYKNFKVSDRLTVAPYLGTFLEQANSIADRGSDAVVIITTTYKISPKISLEEMTLFGNLIIEPEESDWVNRFRVSYSSRHLDVIPSVWHNNKVLDHSSYWSAGLNVAYSRILVADHVNMSAGITGLVVLQTSDESANPKRNALMLTIGMQWVR